MAISKEDLLELINEIPDGQMVRVEAVLATVEDGDAEELFDFDCKIRTFVNSDDGDVRLRVEGVNEGY